MTRILQWTSNCNYFFLKKLHSNYIQKKNYIQNTFKIHSKKNYIQKKTTFKKKLHSKKETTF